MPAPQRFRPLEDNLNADFGGGGGADGGSDGSAADPWYNNMPINMGYPTQNPYPSGPGFVQQDPTNDPTGGIDPTQQDPSNPTGDPYPGVPGLGGPAGINLGPYPLPGTPPPQGPTMSGNFPGVSRPAPGTPPQVPQVAGRVPPTYPPVGGPSLTQNTPPAAPPPTTPPAPTNPPGYPQTGRIGYWGPNRPPMGAPQPPPARTPPAYPPVGRPTYTGPPTTTNPRAGQTRTPPTWPSTGGPTLGQNTPPVGGPTYTGPPAGGTAGTSTTTDTGGGATGGSVPSGSPTPSTPPPAPQRPPQSQPSGNYVGSGYTTPLNAGMPGPLPYTFQPIGIQTGGMGGNVGQFANAGFGGTQDPWKPNPNSPIGQTLSQAPQYNPSLANSLGIKSNNRWAQLLLGLGGL